MSNAVRLDSKKIKRFIDRPWLLYFFVFPLFISVSISLFKSEYLIFLFKLGMFALFVGSVALVSRGLRISQKYQEAIITKAPFPFKLVGSIGIGISIFILTFIIDKAGFLQSVFISILGVVGVLLNYGLDPIADKLPKNSTIDPDLLLQGIKEAEDTLEEIEREKDDISDNSLKIALDGAIVNAKKILNTIKSDPKDIRVARKFLVVYLNGIKTVITQYNDLDSKLIDNNMRERLISLLKDAELRFEKELERLKSNDLFDLDVQIDALKEQLKY